jgi:prophage antirepressor-like protein
MSNLAQFAFADHQVRVILIDDQPWFVAVDICKVLDLENSSRAIARLKDYEKGVTTILTLGGKQDVAIISEPGLYRLILTSRKPQAEFFQDWICQVVLPQIKSYSQFDFSTSPESNKSGFIYLIACQGKYKIGMSKTPYKRLSSLQVGSPFELTILERYFSFDCVALEKLLHEYYEAYWLRGEWFELPFSEINCFSQVVRELDEHVETKLIELKG